MDFEAIRSYLEKAPGEDEPAKIHELPYKFFDPFIVKGLHLDLVEPNRIVCSFKVPTRLLNTGNTLQGRAIASLVDLVGSAAIFASVLILPAFRLKSTFPTWISLLPMRKLR